MITAHLATLPPWLCTLMTQPGTHTRQACSDTPPPIPEGQRNNTLASLAGTMRRRGMSVDAIAAALLFENGKRCEPPLPEHEVLNIAASIARYEPGALFSQGALPRQSVAGELTIDYLTDLGNARRLVARHGPNLRFCPPWKQWLFWNQALWARDLDGEVMRRAKETVESIYAEINAAKGQSEMSKALLRHAEWSQAEPRLKAMINLAESELGIPALPEQFDADLWLLNVRNGAIDLRTGELRAHRREELITKLAPVVYDPAAHCPVWLAFLHRVMDGNEALITFLQRTMGYVLTGATSEQVLFYLHGTGSNGKSTFLETVRALLGAYAMQTDFTTFLQHKYDSVRNDIARLQGARFVSSVEAEMGQRLSESVIKQLTGQDRISARFLYQEFFEYTPQFKLFLAANHKVPIWGTDHAIWRRIRLIPFTVTISEDEKDEDLPKKLYKELPGILAWAVRGCLDWQREGLSAPEEVLLATAGYREEMDIVGGFLEDCCELDPEAQSSTQGLYEVYVKWCEHNGEPVMGKNAFGSKLSERGFIKVRRKNNRGWRGLRVNADWNPWRALKESLQDQPDS